MYFIFLVSCFLKYYMLYSDQGNSYIISCFHVLFSQLKIGGRQILLIFEISLEQDKSPKD